MTKNQNEPSNSQGQAKFLSDKPLTADYKQNDRFGHSGIAENLKQIVLTCPVPFTIGLFGKWGTGKTTVLNILKDRLRTQKVPVVTFDVWKHEGDALRRTFLKELVKQLKTQGIPKDFTLSEQVDSSIGIKKTFEKLNIFNCVVTYILLGLMILLGVIFYLTDIPTFKGYLSIVTGSSLVAGLIIFLIQRMIVTENITKTTNRFEDPHEFEGEFLNIIGRSNAQKLLIAIDNLDRCTHDNAVKLLSTIKTFLAKDSDTEKNNNCIFLITCDDGAIKKHLESVYIKNQNIKDQNNKDSKAFSSDEFLRKFFNTFVRLPDFIDTELQSYTRELLRETNIPQFDSANLAFVINAAFRDNPRQIKQFINILISHFLMAQNREAGANPLIRPAGTITENVPFLAKFLVVRQKFPDIYRTISQRYLVPEEWGRYGNTDFKDFHNATKMFTVGDVRPFMYLKQSPEERKIPGLRQIERGLVENNQDGVLKELQGLEKESEKVTHFNRFLLDLIERYRHVKSSLINILGCSLAVSKNLGLELDEQFYRRFEHLLNDPDGLKNDLHHFSSSLVFGELLPRCKDRHRVGIIGEYVKYICLPRHEKNAVKISPDQKGKSSIGRNFAYDLLEEFVKNKHWLNNDEKEKIKGAIENAYYNDIEVLSLFEDDVENQKDFISEEAISKFVSNFSEEDVQDIDSINEKITLLLKFRPIIKSKTTESIIKKLDELLEAENKLPLEGVDEDEVGQKQNLMNRIEDVLSAVVSEIKSESSKENLNTFANKLNHGANALPNWNDRKIFVFSFLLIIDLIDDPNSKTKLEQFIQNFFSNADLESIKFVFGNKRLSRNKKTKLIDRYPSVFQQRAVSLQPIFNELYPIASKKNRIEWLVALISSDHKRAVQKLEAEGYKADDNKQIVQALLQKVTTVAVPEKHAIYNTVSKMKCANDKTLKSTLVSQIKSLLKTTDPQGQKVGYHALEGAYSFLSGPNKRDIATEVIEWLRNLEPASAGQVHSVGSIFLVWNDLADTPRQGVYIDFISDKLIVRGTSLNSVKLGIQTLIKVKPTYENYSKQYDDIFARFETEPDQNIKIVINGGLVNLKPEKTNRENKAFWTKIKKWDVDNDGE